MELNYPQALVKQAIITNKENVEFEEHDMYLTFDSERLWNLHPNQTRIGYQIDLEGINS